MVRERIFILFMFVVFAIPNVCYGDKYDSLLVALDHALDHCNEYDLRKEEVVKSLKNKLRECRSKDSQHEIYNALYKEYEAYVFDSAVHYAQLHLTMSESEADTCRINDCKMQLSRMYAIYARFPEALDILNSIDKNELTAKQLGDYYDKYSVVYDYQSEYIDGAEKRKYIDAKNRYLDSALSVMPEGSYEFEINYGRKCIAIGYFEMAEKMLLSHLSKIEKDTRDYAILTSYIAYMYEKEGKSGLQKIYLAESAIADVRASVKENISIGLLSMYLLNDGEITRSNRYVKKSLEDANFYNARLRNIQVAKILPIIDKAYQLERERQQKNMRMAIAFIGLLLLFLVALVFYLAKQMGKLSKTRQELIHANEELKNMNGYLAENNLIKEEYIGRFLNQCSAYINKLEAYRRSLNRKAADGKTEDLFKMLKSSKIIDDELREFYQNFDTAFLDIFPDFVDQFNRLLTPENRIKPKHKGELSAELRIFALIRLGITDSSKIAVFLRYSITTIYNYRSKYRNKALAEPACFEENIMKINSGGAFQLRVKN